VKIEAARAIQKENRQVVYDNRRWADFSGRDDDIFVCTPPKCGTTWMQTIVVALLFPDGDAPGPVMHIAPWIDNRVEPIGTVLARLDAQKHRRCIKTHTPADGIPWFAEASYIVVGRDGRDAFMSYHNHMANMRPDLVADLAASARAEGIEIDQRSPPPVDDIHAFFAWCVEFGLLFEHISSFWRYRDEPNVLFVHYDDMKADLEGSMRRVAAFLGIEIDEARWPRLVESCTFGAMKARSDEIGEFKLFVGGGETFLYKGTNDRWRGVLTEAELARFDRAAAEQLPPDAAAWLNRS
jgi:aryl sulfotransferase